MINSDDDFFRNLAAPLNFPKTLWIVTIPKGGEFRISYTKSLTLRQRFFMKMIGWNVEKVEQADD